LIQAELVLDNEGLLRFCKIEGHSGAETRGNDIVCASVSVLAKAIAIVLEKSKDIKVRGDIPERGSFLIEADYSPEGKDFLKGAGSCLIEGLQAVEKEFPQYLKVNIERRNSYGT